MSSDIFSTTEFLALYMVSFAIYISVVTQRLIPSHREALCDNPNNGSEGSEETLETAHLKFAWILTWTLSNFTLNLSSYVLHLPVLLKLAMCNPFIDLEFHIILNTHPFPTWMRFAVSYLFCLHYSTGTHNTTMFIYGRVGQPSHRAVYLTYMQMCINIKYYINNRTEAPKPDTKTPKNQQVEKTRGTCTPDQCSGATLGVLGYASA